MRTDSKTGATNREMPTPAEGRAALRAAGCSEAECDGAAMVYRSTGLGVYAVVVRYVTMPFEKVAMIANSSQVSTGGGSQLAQAVRITFRESAFGPWLTVGRASIVAWFLQYSVMGFVFQICDASISAAFGVDRMPYGEALMDAPKPAAKIDAVYSAKYAAKTVLAPVVAGALESVVSNRAETQRFWGLEKSAAIERRLAWGAAGRVCGPAFVANSARNFIMSTTSFVLTPTLYQRYFPADRKDARSLFWFGLGVNIFAGNVVAITQQSLWGRVLDYMAVGGGRDACYRTILADGYAKEGVASLFTLPKWFSRVMMNAPIQGTVPWFYNEILPLGEGAYLAAAARGAAYRAA